MLCILVFVDLRSGYLDIDHRNGTVSRLNEYENAKHLYDASQVVASPKSSTRFAVKSGAVPIVETPLCSTTTYFKGEQDKYKGESDADAYKRDPENKFISLGKIQYMNHDDDKAVLEGCRVDKDQDLYWETDPATKRGEVVKVKPQKYVLDNFVRTVEEFWTIPGFQL